MSNGRFWLTLALCGLFAAGAIFGAVIEEPVLVSVAGALMLGMLLGLLLGWED